MARRYRRWRVRALRRACEQDGNPALWLAQSHALRDHLQLGRGRVEFLALNRQYLQLSQPVGVALTLRHPSGAAGSSSHIGDTDDDGWMLNFDEDLALAHNLADVAGTITLGFFERDLQKWSKTDGSLATEADVAVEDALRDLLRAQRATDAFLGEERGQSGSGSRRWIIDGIDGTVEFAARSPDWGTLIALEEDGRVVVSVCDQPAHRRRYWAVKGRGAYCRYAVEGMPVPLRASATGDLAAARSYVPPARWLPDAAAHRIAAAVANATTPSPQDNHPALQVASGGYDVALFLIAGPWDIAAPALIVEEAGGRFSDLTGRHHLESGNAVFTNGIVHDHVLKVVSAASSSWSKSTHSMR